MSSSRRDDHHHHHDSTRHRLSRIAGQLGAGMAPKYYRSGSSSSSPSTSSTSSSSPADRLLSISRQLGGAVVTPTALRQGAAGVAAQQHHPHLAAPHSEAKQWERLPRYRELPTEGGFPGCAWSVWGPNDQLGTLNLLTGPVVARAAKEEIRTGHSITLSWPMHLPRDAAFGRKAVEHKARGKAGPQYAQIRDAALHERRIAGEQVEDRSEKGEGAGMPLADDELSLNLQAGSQWDGLSHFGHLSLNCYYGGRTRKQIHDSFEKPHRPVDPRGEVGPELGMQAWAQKGMQGRGVLLDVWGYLVRNNEGRPPYDPAGTHAITLEQLRDCARAQGVTFRQGDILLIRTGWTVRYYNSSDAERQVGASGKKGYVGLEQGDAMLEWLWDNHFAAVASDAPALERWPCPLGQTHLHETLLAMWGMPIGEMFDLEQVTEHCLRNRRWTFYFSSWPLNLWGGVASTANAGATF